MNPLELRKILLIGYRFDFDGNKPLLDARGMPTEPVSSKWWGTFAFWIPARSPFQRCDGETKATQALPHERQALRDGAIIEHVQEFEFAQQPGFEEMRARMMAVWEVLTEQELGFVPNAAPRDSSERLVIQYAPVVASTSR